MFGDEVSDPLFRSIDPFLIGMYDGDTPRPVIRVVFALGSERSIVKFVSQGPSVDRRAINLATLHIWCVGLSPETFPLIGADIEPYWGLLDHSNHRFEQYDVQSFELRG